MIDERFSSDSFASCGLDSEKARELVKLLAEEIQKEMHLVIVSHFLKIVEELNRMGHALKPEYPPSSGDISYRDDWRDESGYHCKLRIGIDTVISTGYAHLIDPDEAWRQYAGSEEEEK